MRLDPARNVHARGDFSTEQFFRCVMNKQIFSILAALAVAVSSTPIESAFAKQQCHESIAMNQRGYWSWRMIDGRKCWYEGKPMLSKSSLEWPAQATNHPSSDEELASVLTKRSDPLDAQAKATDADTFEALWRTRVDHRW
jgi:hypothetical protein